MLESVFKMVTKNMRKEHISEVLKIILKALTLQTILGHIITPLALISKTLPSLKKKLLEQEKCLNRGTLP